MQNEDFIVTAQFRIAYSRLLRAGILDAKVVDLIVSTCLAEALEGLTGGHVVTTFVVMGFTAHQQKQPAIEEKLSESEQD